MFYPSLWTDSLTTAKVKFSSLFKLQAFLQTVLYKEMTGQNYCNDMIMIVPRATDQSSANQVKG